MSGSDRPLVLVVGADAGVRALACKALQRDGLRALEIADGRGAGAEVLACKPDLLVLDLTTEALDAGVCCREIRAHGPLAILFLASSHDALDLAMDLECAGDEVMIRPANLRDLATRARVVLRTCVLASGADSRLRAPRSVARGALRLELHRPRAYWGEVEVNLTVTEVAILRMLLGEPGRIFSWEELAHATGDPSVVLDAESVEWYLRRIHRKFGAVGGDPARVVPQRGHRLAVE
jgi:DNA-binding response OmpR family regulator